MKHKLLMLTIMAVVTTAAAADVIQFQAGVLPDASYDHACSTVGEGLPVFGDSEGYCQVAEAWSNTDHPGFALMRYDISAISSSSSITSARLRVHMARIGGDQSTWPWPHTFLAWRLHSDNAGWNESEARFSQMSEVACWPHTGCTMAGLWPSSHPLAPAFDAYNALPDVIAEATVQSGVDYNTEPEVVLEFTAAGIAYLQGILDGTVIDAGFILGAGPELLNAFANDTFIGMVDEVSAQSATESRPMLEVEYTAGPVDSDDDGLEDQVETDTGVYVSPTNTGTDPNDADSDDDGYEDGAEVDAGTDPNDNASYPGSGPELPAMTMLGMAALASAMAAAAVRKYRK